MNYFIQLDDQPHGPLTADQVRLGIKEGRYKAGDLVRRDAESDWKPLSALTDFVITPNGKLGRVRNPLAKASLALGYAAIIFFLIFVLGSVIRRLEILSTISIAPLLLAPLLAIIFAKVALRKISRSLTEVEGYWCAKSGLRLGYTLLLIIPIGVSLIVPTFAKTCAKGNVTKAINNCKQIITTLKLYAADNNGNYPDFALPNARTSNEVFRELFKSGVADSEAIFGCPNSSDGIPDGNIGRAPDFAEALKPHENHWAMTKGVTDSDSGNIPLVYESPADATWPPKWNPDLAGTSAPGRTWIGGKVVIGFEDGSVLAKSLESSKGQRVGFRPLPDGSSLFPNKLEVLDVAR